MRSHAAATMGIMEWAPPDAATCASSHTHTHQQVRESGPNWTRGNERLSRLDAGFIFYYVAQTSVPLLALGGAPALGLP